MIGIVCTNASGDTRSCWDTLADLERERERERVNKAHAGTCLRSTQKLTINNVLVIKRRSRCQLSGATEEAVQRVTQSKHQVPTLTMLM